MIRRGFWLVTGAVLGVTGYRKATRLARTLAGGRLAGGQVAVGQQTRGQLTGGQLTGGQVTGGQRALAGGEQRLRDGAGHAQAQLAMPAYPRVRPRPAVRSGAERVAAAIGFVRDVRDGMAEYRDLHRGELDRNLESQGDARGTPSGTLESRSDRARSGSPEDCR